MNRTGAGAPDVTSVITTAHLALIVILAVLAVLVILWGGRRRRARRIAPGEADERRGRDAGPVPVESAEREPAIATPPLGVAPLETPPTTAPPPPIIDAPAGDRLPVTTLKGLGPKVAARLAELGITHVDQLAALSGADAEALDARLGAFSGRMTRDRWIEQAQLLTAGDRAGFEAKFGKLG